MPESASRGGVCSRGDVCSQGSAPGGGGAWYQGGIPACTEADPPVNRMTDRCKNITLATTSLWPVTRMHSNRMRTARLPIVRVSGPPLDVGTGEVPCLVSIGGGLHSKLQCIMGSGHMEPPM